MEVCEVSPAIGAEVGGIDLRESLSDQLVDELQSLFVGGLG